MFWGSLVPLPCFRFPYPLSPSPPIEQRSSAALPRARGDHRVSAVDPLSTNNKLAGSKTGQPKNDSPNTLLYTRMGTFMTRLTLFAPVGPFPDTEEPARHVPTINWYENFNE